MLSALALAMAAGEEAGPPLLAGQGDVRADSVVAPRQATANAIAANSRAATPRVDKSIVPIQYPEGGEATPGELIPTP